MPQFPSAGAKIVHQSALVTEYDDGTEEVRFTEEEWAQMATDPRFGYVLACGHPASAAISDGSCSLCEGMMASQYEDPVEEAVTVVDTPAPATPDAINDDIPF